MIRKNKKQKNKDQNSAIALSIPMLDDPASSFDPSVTFINSEVLQAKDVTFTGTAKPMADQSAAMMIEDMRSYLQGTEQVLMIAVARCLQQIVETDGAKGTKALKECESFMKVLPTFATSIAASAESITTNFE